MNHQLRNTKQPGVAKYLDKCKFSKVCVSTGLLSWNDGQMEIDGQWIYSEVHKHVPVC